MKIDKPPICPHCKKETEKYDVYPWDGVGWGVPFLYVCFNDECPLYAKGKGHLWEKYGQVASYRYMVYPDTGTEGIIAAMNSQNMEARMSVLDENLESEDSKE